MQIFYFIIYPENLRTIPEKSTPIFTVWTWSTVSTVLKKKAQLVWVLMESSCKCVGIGDFGCYSEGKTEHTGGAVARLTQLSPPESGERWHSPNCLHGQPYGWVSHPHSPEKEVIEKEKERNTLHTVFTQTEAVAHIGFLCCNNMQQVSLPPLISLRAVSGEVCQTPG